MQTRTKRALSLFGLLAVLSTAATTAAEPQRRQERRAEAAHRDSYPRYEFRSTLRRTDPIVGRVLPIGSSYMTTCIMARNRHTRKAMMVIPIEFNEAQAMQMEQDCMAVFESYAAEKSG